MLTLEGLKALHIHLDRSSWSFKSGGAISPQRHLLGLRQRVGEGGLLILIAGRCGKVLQRIAPTGDARAGFLAQFTFGLTVLFAHRQSPSQTKRETNCR
jgi:hypothetical protein